MSRFIEEQIQGKENLEDRKEKLLRVFKKSVLTASELRSRKVEKRPKLLGEWLRKGDLGFIFAPRGRGKTWFSMAVAKALAIGAGAKVGVWEACEAQTVLYVDGEMALDDTQGREIALDGDAGNRLHFLHHSVIFEDAEETLNLTDKSAQDAITATLLHLKATVLVMDNLSSLFYGLKENENDSWEAVLPWLLELRRRGICIIIVHHAGTNESRMRGATKREDACHWVIRLDASVHGDAEEGARFCTAFTKNRNCPGKDAQSVEFYFKPNGLHIGKVDVVCSIVDSLERFRICIREMKLESASEIADEMSSSRGYVSKLAQKAEKEGWCRIQDRKYTYHEPGCPPF